jgi:hypothetical protein
MYHLPHALWAEPLNDDIDYAHPTACSTTTISRPDTGPILSLCIARNQRGQLDVNALPLAIAWKRVSIAP